MHPIIEQLLDPEKLIYAGGLILLLAIVFIENGIFFGFFLPGDTLLFTAGLLCATDKFKVSIFLLLSTVCAAAILGNLFGYYFGSRVGNSIFMKKDSLLFKKKYLFAAEVFFKKYGGMALIMGRFLPILRTFAPIFAGIVKFEWKKFLIYNFTGGILWVFSMLLAGFFLGRIFPGIKSYLEYIIIGIVVVTWLPVIITVVKERLKIKNNNKSTDV